MRFLKSYKIFESKSVLEDVILSCFEEQIDNNRIYIIKSDDSDKEYYINFDIEAEFLNKIPEREHQSAFIIKLVPTETGFHMICYKPTTGDLSRIYPEEYQHLEDSLDYLGHKITKVDDYPRMVMFLKSGRWEMGQHIPELGQKFMRHMIYKIEEI